MQRLSAFLNSAIAANKEIHDALDTFRPEWYEKHAIGAGGDRSSGLDLFAEEIFIRHLHPFGRIESEESGVVGEGEASIILDPIDGSSNALSHFPYYGTSAALQNASGLLEEAIVCNLANGDIFMRTAEGKKLYASLHHDRIEPLVALSRDAEIGLFEKAYAQPALVAALDEAGLKFRAPGAVALSLAYAHTVNYVLFVGDVRIYDFAAGLALCEGLEVYVQQDYVIVSKSKKIAQQLLDIVESQR